ncbi:nascent polypeptide-associated complex subunit alpha, muscle-specific form-like [Triticum dicoccoides]|uniref:nascent polypeptide-associated complex subunit alpha, muscle-specific form-like n=1 Tax=Triticum dicoccoides TaxID=85692 RepID=UPI001891A14A|nr:nascent polypeptide-associated complex subunit alpha, muscle-specific form-like [Triticum dicoccoides]
MVVRRLPYTADTHPRHWVRTHLCSSSYASSPLRFGCPSTRVGAAPRWPARPAEPPRVDPFPASAPLCAGRAGCSSPSTPLHSPAAGSALLLICATPRAQPPPHSAVLLRLRARASASGLACAAGFSVPAPARHSRSALRALAVGLARVHAPGPAGRCRALPPPRGLAAGCASSPPHTGSAPGYATPLRLRAPLWPPAPPPGRPVAACSASGSPCRPAGFPASRPDGSAFPGRLPRGWGRAPLPPPAIRLPRPPSSAGCRPSPGQARPPTAPRRRPRRPPPAPSTPRHRARLPSHLLLRLGRVPAMARSSASHPVGRPASSSHSSSPELLLSGFLRLPRDPAGRLPRSPVSLEPGPVPARPRRLQPATRRLAGFARQPGDPALGRLRPPTRRPGAWPAPPRISATSPSRATAGPLTGSCAPAAAGSGSARPRNRAAASPATSSAFALAGPAPCRASSSRPRLRAASRPARLARPSGSGWPARRPASASTRRASSGPRCSLLPPSASGKRKKKKICVCIRLPRVG